VITPKFNQGGTGVLDVSFHDENGTPIVPNSVTWSLYARGQIVNEREEVSIAAQQSVEIVLSGDDLVGGWQWLEVKARYDSSAGSDLPLVEWQKISVEERPES